MSSTAIKLPQPATELKNFSSLLEKLVAVPKTEVDEKKAEYEKKRRAKKRRARLGSKK